MVFFVQFNQSINHSCAAADTISTDSASRGPSTVTEILVLRKRSSSTVWHAGGIAATWRRLDAAVTTLDQHQFALNIRRVGAHSPSTPH